jgi:predicted DNA-binding antitoxin AbrB/MazE fold protein
MTRFITAVFADGVLKPEQELGLMSGTRVQLIPPAVRTVPS